MNETARYQQHSGSSLYAGTMLRGCYRVENVLGQGGFGITYAALDTKRNYRVAVKELFPARCVMRAEDRRTVLVQPGHDNEFQQLRESFKKEAQVLIDLQNLEGVVRIMHVFLENNTVYYVMELLEGETLIQRLKREGPLPWGQLAPILKTIMQALEQIHQVGLIHRDISPDNIFLTREGARLIDFGSVRNFHGATHLTAMVKQNFAPWEQFLSQGHQGPWTDVYALAVTAYYSLSGQLPPPATERRISDTLVPLAQLCPGLPAEVYAAIHSGMMVLPETRFQNMREFSYALRLEEITFSPARSGCNLICIQGSFAGWEWYLQPDTMLRIGRNPDCDICYPMNSPGISRAQCTIYRTRDGKYLVRDDNSRYGTRLTSPGKTVALEPGIWYAANGAHILFGAHEEYVLSK